MRITLTVACTLALLALPVSASAVVGGKAVQPGAYPFVVAVGDTAGPACGGTLIAPRVVLTAAHCVAAEAAQPGKLRVWVGSAKLSSDASTTAAGHQVGVTAVYAHPKFDPKSMRYDAALLILDQPVAGVRTIPMADHSPLAGTVVSAAGWGETHEHGATSPEHLRSVTLKIGTIRTCRRGNSVLGEYFAPSMMCASKPGRDTCSGDSGGPLVASQGGRTTLVGITSFGYGCAQAAHPGVYTRVSAIRAWALAQVTRATETSG